MYIVPAPSKDIATGSVVGIGRVVTTVCACAGTVIATPRAITKKTDFRFIGSLVLVPIWWREAVRRGTACTRLQHAVTLRRRSRPVAVRILFAKVVPTQR